MARTLHEPDVMTSDLQSTGSQPVLVGAVLYDPKVSVIWDIIRDFFEENGCPVDVVFFTNYELQNRNLLAGQLDVAWNSPLAWVDAQRLSGGTCRAIAMRDTDRDRVSHIVTAEGHGVTGLEDLRGKTVAFGAKDSPQATLIPQGLLLRHGLAPGHDYTARRFDILVGKHGDHIGGEKEAMDCLRRGEVAAACVLDLNWDAWTKDGSVDRARFRILATTGQFDHCVFTVRQDFPAETEKRWLEVLHRMSYENPKHREMMDMEGLKQWEPGRTTGFSLLKEACEKLKYFEG
jgi:ABC-type phosphate/phosphonate transport system substrate-binding protein